MMGRLPSDALVIKIPYMSTVKRNKLETHVCYIKNIKIFKIQYQFTKTFFASM